MSGRTHSHHVDTHTMHVHPEAVDLEGQWAGRVGEVCHAGRMRIGNPVAPHGRSHLNRHRPWVVCTGGVGVCEH